MLSLKPLCSCLVAAHRFLGGAPTFVPLGWLGTVAAVLLAVSGTPGPVRWPGTLPFLHPQVRLAHQAPLSWWLIRLLGDGGHCRYDISGVFPNS